VHVVAHGGAGAGGDVLHGAVLLLDVLQVVVVAVEVRRNGELLQQALRRSTRGRIHLRAFLRDTLSGQCEQEEREVVS
jgi:hypothetical protein